MSTANVLSTVSPHEEVEIKGLDVTIYDFTPHLTRVHVETIQEGKPREQDTAAHSSDFG